MTEEEKTTKEHLQDIGESFKKGVITGSRQPFAQVIRGLSSLAIGYAGAAFVSSHVSMTLAATAWGSGWTYFWWAIGIMLSWVAPLGILLFLITSLSALVCVILVIVGAISLLFTTIRNRKKMRKLRKKKS